MKEGQLDEFKNPPESPKSDIIEAKVEEVKQPTVSSEDIIEIKTEEQPSISPEGAKNENSSNRWEAHRVLMMLLLLLNLYLIPVRLHEVYLTDGLISRRFANSALCAFIFLLVYIASFEIIGHRTCAVFMLPAIIGFIATWEWDLQLCIILGVSLVLLIIIMCIVVICDKFFGKDRDHQDIPPID